jgi:hypothetical protein
MRARQSLAPFAACAAVVCIAGCGASGSQQTPKVNLSIIAPISGATVGVHEIMVTGTVSPATAEVAVGGQPAKVVHGSFTRPLSLAQASETITVTAKASGYSTGSASTTVQYSPQIAAQLVAAKAAQVRAAKLASITPKNVNTLAPATSGGGSKAVSSAFSLQSPKSGNSSGGSSGGGSSSAGSGGGSSSTPTSQPKSTPTPAPPLTVAEIKTLWIKSCVKANKNQKFASYCRCTYTHLESNGWLRSRDRVLALDRKLRRYDRTHNPADLPRFVRRAITACVSKVPPLDPLSSGKPVIKKLPGQAHGRVPSPGLPTSG